eukprot:g20536.t2
MVALFLAGVVSENFGYVICLIANHLGLAASTALAVGWTMKPDWLQVQGLPDQEAYVVQRVIFLTAVAFFLPEEVDRLHYAARELEGLQLRKHYQGSTRYASCSERHDEEKICQEIGEKAHSVDQVIQVLISAGMSSPALREAQMQGVSIEHAGARWQSMMLQALSVFARLCFIILLCWRSIDERCFMLKVMTKLVSVMVIPGLVAFCLGASLLTTVMIVFIAFHISFLLVLVFAFLGIRGTLHLPGGPVLVQFFLTRFQRGSCDAPDTDAASRTASRTASDATGESRSSTRHIFCPGETIVTQGKRSDGRKPQARRLSDGKVVGEEMLMKVTHKWRYSLCCLSFCDVIILHRRPFLTMVKDAKPPSSSEEGLECQRLAFLLEGPWREDRPESAEQVIVSLPLFHGFDSKFLSVLPQLMETRVVLPGHKIWETTLEERSLFLLLHGNAEEVVTTYKKRRASQMATARARSHNAAAQSEFLMRTNRRALCQSSCEGGAHLLGLKQVGECQVVAKSIVVVALLHRPVFLHLLHSQNVKIQAPEVLKLLSEELDNTEEAEEEFPSVESLELCLPILRGLDEAFMSSLLQGGSGCFYMEGQQLCPPRVLSESLFVVIRGEVWTEMAGIFLGKYCQGQALHILGLAKGFTPSYESRCQRISEVWDLPREVLLKSLDHYPSMKRILSALTNMQLARLTTAGAEDPSEPTQSRTLTPLSPPSSPRAGPEETKPVDLVPGRMSGRSFGRRSRAPFAGHLGPVPKRSDMCR